MKFERLSNNELESLEKEFIQFLVVNGIVATDWEKIKKEDAKKAEKLIELFSDMVWAKSLEKIKFLEHRTPTSIKVFNCKKEMIELIGVDADQAKTVSAELAPYILTSMIKRVDVAVYNTIKAVVDGTFAGGVTVFDLSVDGVGYSTTGGWIDDIVSDIEAYKAQIISGDIEVPAAP